MRRLFGLVCDFALVSMVGISRGPDLPIPKHPGTREIVDSNGQTTTETGARSYSTRPPNVLQAIPPDSILIPSASSLPRTRWFHANLRRSSESQLLRVGRKQRDLYATDAAHR